MSITENIKQYKEEIETKGATLIAISKTKPASDIQEAYDAGHRDFGENKVQEMDEKHEELPKDIRWHMVGHLQRNKVKYIVDYVHLIHGVDSKRLLKEINKQAKKADKKVSCLLQIHIAKEESKFGLDEAEAEEILSQLSEYPNVSIKGLMGIATNTEDQGVVKGEFQELKALFDRWNIQYDGVDFSILSMGMSGDYALAISEGSNCVRIGSAIFGARHYTS
jgi:pyridoxal phosphate enzyme (YggS family)